MMNFCTYFDSYYMLKGLGLYTSLERVSNDFHLFVMAFDQECFDKLKSLNLKHMTVELLSTIETPELLAVNQLVQEVSIVGLVAHLPFIIS